MKQKSNNPVGVVTESLPDLRYRVKLEDGKEVMGYLSGKMKINRINVYVGDKVEIILDPYGGAATNRIVRRL
jgi:translation initiation factor IF-1